MKTVKYLCFFVAGAIVALCFVFGGAFDFMFDVIDREAKFRAEVRASRCAAAGENPSPQMREYCQHINP